MRTSLRAASGVPASHAGAPGKPTCRVECLDHTRATADDSSLRLVRPQLHAQHEIDHLHGTLSVDHMESRSLCTLDNYSKHWKELTLTRSEGPARAAVRYNGYYRKTEKHLECLDESSSISRRTKISLREGSTRCGAVYTSCFAAVVSPAFAPKG